VTRVGLLGGTFDPIHVGHLDVAIAAREALGLERILLVPSRVPPHRRVPNASAAHRFAMAAMAAATTPGLLVSDIEMNADGPSYTASTLDRLAAAGVPVRSLFFIIGADAFGDIATWMQYPGVLDRCHFAVVSRPGSPAPALRVALPSLAARMIETPCGIPAEPSIFLIDAPTAPVSSTEVRRRLAGGASIAGLVPDVVAAHIARHGLY